MKLLHVIPYFAPVYGGPVQAVRDIARMQAESGIAVDIVTTRANGATELASVESRMTEAGGVGIHYFERVFPRRWFRSPAMDDWLMQHAHDYDALHLHVPFTYPLRSAVLAARRNGLPYAVTPHGLFDPWSLAHKRWKKAPYLALVERRHLADARVIHVTSNLEARGLNELGISTEIRRIPLAVTPSEQSVQREGRRGLRLLFLSRLHPVKDVPTLLRAVAQLGRPDIRLTIAGEGEAQYVASLHALAREFGIGAAVDFSGHLKAREKDQVWRDHDLFVLPSLHENFSLSTVEALATGMPAIVTDQVGVADRIQAAGAGRTVPCAEPGALAAAITAMLDDRTRRQAGTQARLLVEREFSTKILRTAYVQLAADLSSRT